MRQTANTQGGTCTLSSRCTLSLQIQGGEEKHLVVFYVMTCLPAELNIMKPTLRSDHWSVVMVHGTGVVEPCRRCVSSGAGGLPPASLEETPLEEVLNSLGWGFLVLVCDVCVVTSAWTELSFLATTKKAKWMPSQTSSALSPS